jgi:amino acid transporter
MTIAASAARVRRRRVKVRGGHLGPFLCWAVVFADIGTSIYYVPGILFGHFGVRSTLFVLMTMCAFVFLSFKYAEVARRYPEGGGVVTVASRAFHPFAGLLGGLFILVDYYLTAALSALSGVFYLAVVIPALRPSPVVVVSTLIALLALGVLNVIGIRESAAVSAVVATVAGAGQLLVVVATAVHLGPAGIVQSVNLVTRGAALGPKQLVVGYAAAFLAFSGLESIAQVAPAMRQPRRTVALRAMGLVILSIAVTSPVLTLWSTTVLPRGSDPNQFISILGLRSSGPALADFVAVSGATLLVFASNTAIIGAYHVLIAMIRMGFLPRLLEVRNRARRTPHWAIAAAVGLPVVLVISASGSIDLLGDLYAFGLLAAFTLTCLGLDAVRWREGMPRSGPLGLGRFAVGVLTTLAVLVAWCVNLVAKTSATEFGGGLTLIGLVLGLGTYRYNIRRRPVVFPVPFERASAAIMAAFERRPADVLVILPGDADSAELMLREAFRVIGRRSAVFLYRGELYQSSMPRLWEVNDPYLKDFAAQDAFARTETIARRAGVRDRRYVYVPGGQPSEVVGDVWRTIRPRETVADETNQEVLPPLALDRVRRHRVDGQVVLHMFSSRAPRAVA